MSAKKRPSGIVYSTNPEYQYKWNENAAQDTPAHGEQDLRVHLLSLKGNKKATIVRGFKGSEQDMKDVGKKLKSACGVGGSVKNGEIIIQGDKRDKVIILLLDEGYRAKKSGG